MAVPDRMSNRHAKSGEDMMEVLAHDIMRYEALSEQSDLFALALARNAPNDQYTVIELNVPAVPQVAQPTQWWCNQLEYILWQKEALPVRQQSGMNDI